MESQERGNDISRVNKLEESHLIFRILESMMVGVQSFRVTMTKTTRCAATKRASGNNREPQNTKAREQENE